MFTINNQANPAKRNIHAGRRQWPADHFNTSMTRARSRRTIGKATCFVTKMGVRIWHETLAQGLQYLNQLEETSTW